MSQTVGDFIVGRLAAWGVKRIFGYPGDGINGVLGAMNRSLGTIEFAQVQKLTSTVMKGDPAEGGIIKGAARQVLASILPGDR